MDCLDAQQMKAKIPQGDNCCFCYYDWSDQKIQI